MPRTSSVWLLAAALFLFSAVVWSFQGRWFGTILTGVLATGSFLEARRSSESTPPARTP